MYCSYCGAQIPDDSTFCSVCGKNLQAAAAPATAEIPAVAPALASMPEVQPVMETPAPPQPEPLAAVQTEAPPMEAPQLMQAVPPPPVQATPPAYQPEAQPAPMQHAPMQQGAVPPYQASPYQASQPVQAPPVPPPAAPQGYAGGAVPPPMGGATRVPPAKANGEKVNSTLVVLMLVFGIVAILLAGFYLIRSLANGYIFYIFSSLIGQGGGFMVVLDGALFVLQNLLYLAMGGLLLAAAVPALTGGNTAGFMKKARLGALLGVVGLALDVIGSLITLVQYAFIYQYYNIPEALYYFVLGGKPFNVLLHIVGLVVPVGALVCLSVMGEKKEAASSSPARPVPPPIAGVHAVPPPPIPGGQMPAMQQPAALQVPPSGAQQQAPPPPPPPPTPSV